MPTRLGEGESFIAAAKIAGNARGYRVAYSVRLHSGDLVRNSAYGPTAAKAKAVAKAKVREALQTGSGAGWKPSDKLDKFIADVTVKLIAESRLRPNTVKRYGDVIRILRGECDCRRSKHSNLGTVTIAAGLRHDRVDDMLRDIAKVHGSENAHHCRSVLAKYIVRPALGRGLITADPMAGLPQAALEGHYRGPRQRETDVVLSEQDYWRVVKYLLNRPEDRLLGTVTKRRASSIRKARQAVRQLLVASATGLRANEIGTLRRDAVHDRDARLYCEVLAEYSKTKKPRMVPVLDDVAEVMRTWLEEGDLYVVGSPANGSTPWDQGNRDGALRLLFAEMADELKLPELEHDFRSHGFRHTLSTIWAGKGVDAEIRAAWFGHTIVVNQAVYTDLAGLDSVAAVMKRLDSPERHLVAV